MLPKLSDQALFVTSRDGRMFFIIPLDAYSLIGTTDTKYPGDLDEVHADQDDVDYLLTESRRILPKMNLTKESILYTYAGIRPLAFSGRSESKISRKHRVIQEGRNRQDHHDRRRQAYHLSQHGKGRGGCGVQGAGEQDTMRYGQRAPSRRTAGGL